MLLSILVPSYERPALLKRLAQTVDHLPDGIEILVGVDGGNYDVDAYHPLQVRNLPRAGRFGVLLALGREAAGRYVMISDDDDFFLPGQLARLAEEVRSFDATRRRDEIGVMCKCDYLNKARSGKESRFRERMDILEPLFRWGVKNDYKQIVDSTLFLAAMTRIPKDAGRVPTSLVWLYCGDNGLVRYRPVSVMVKDYMEQGLSALVKKGRPKGGVAYRQFYVEALRRARSRGFGFAFRIRCLFAIVNSFRKFSA
jgi:glycosyltransferase involved in cell wall biosynthesis